MLESLLHFKYLSVGAKIFSHNGKVSRVALHYTLKDISYLFNNKNILVSS